MKHRETIELLPWYLNGALREDERSAVEVHLRECAECSAELAEWKSVHAAARQLSREAPALGGAALGQVLSRIDAYEQKKQQVQREPARGFSRILEQVRELFWRPSPVFARALVALQFVAILVLGGLLLVSRKPGATGGTTAGSPGTVVQQNTARIAIAFEEEVSEATMRETILRIQGRIVEGPSPNGLYTVEVPISPNRTEEVEKILAELRSNTKVVRFAARKM